MGQKVQGSSFSSTARDAPELAALQGLVAASSRAGQAPEFAVLQQQALTLRSFLLQCSKLWSFRSSGARIARSSELSGARQAPELQQAPELSRARQAPELQQAPELSGARQAPKLQQAPELSGARQAPELSGARSSPELAFGACVASSTAQRRSNTKRNAYLGPTWVQLQSLQAPSSFQIPSSLPLQADSKLQARSRLTSLEPGALAME
jgi:hypothetical protein